jgi:excinuclease ABC subunit C
MPKGRAPDPDALLDAVDDSGDDADRGDGDDGLSKRLREILAKLPGEPGVYLMKDRRGKVIYVGKAASLKSRVRSYFTRSSDTRAFVPLLARIVGDIETVITNTEKEALLLENNLIKQHQPRFNVKLVDDKNFLVLRLDPRARYPRLEVTRRIGKDGARYFGPYHSATSCRATLSLVNRHFKLRTCTDHVLNSRKRPCLQYQIKRCDAPCVFPIPPEEYAKQVDDVSLFLEGKDQDLIARLKARMKEAAAAMEYEVAASVRDQISALEKTLEAQRVVMADQRDQDVIGLYREGDAVEIVVLHVRHGKLLGRRNFSFRGQEFPTEDVLSSFVSLYYDLGAQIPDEVLLPLPIDDAAVKSEWLTDRRERKCEVLTPQRGPRRQLVMLAEKNAASSFVTRRNKTEDMEAALAKLQHRLGLKRIPRRIECFDISHIQGTATVASMVVFVDGEPVKSEYRTFKVKSASNDDFASMYEVISRRFRRSKGAEENEERKGWAVPDLLVIDGGKGQLSSALAALRDAKIDTGMNGIDVVALAKERAVGPEAAGPQTGHEPVEKQPDRVFTARAKDPIALRPNSAELFLLSRVRDEAHRFAVTFHKKLRRRRTLRSALEDVPGVGQKRKRELLKAFGSLRKIREATVEELARAPGMTLAAAEAVARYFGSAPEAARVDDDPAVHEREDVAEDATAEELELLAAEEGAEEDAGDEEDAAELADEDNLD